MARLAESTRNRTVFDKANVPFARSVQAGRPVTAEDQGGSRRLQHRLATLVLDGQALPVLLEALLRGQGLARLVGMQVAGALMHLAEGAEGLTLQQAGLEDLQQHLAAPGALGHVDLLLEQGRRHQLEILQAVVAGTLLLLLAEGLPAAHLPAEGNGVGGQAGDNHQPQAGQNKHGSCRHQGYPRHGERARLSILPMRLAPPYPPLLGQPAQPLPPAGVVSSERTGEPRGRSAARAKESIDRRQEIPGCPLWTRWR